MQPAAVIANTRTTVTVLWQDGTRSEGLRGADLFPVEDLGERRLPRQSVAKFGFPHPSFVFFGKCYYCQRWQTANVPRWRGMFVRGGASAILSIVRTDPLAALSHLAAFKSKLNQYAQPKSSATLMFKLMRVLPRQHCLLLYRRLRFLARRVRD